MANRLSCAILGMMVWAAAASGGDVRLNQIQVIGTHNSYHIAPTAGVMELIARGGKSRAEALDYTHRPLSEQFTTQRIRQIELDAFADPRGGLFANPSFRSLASGLGLAPGPDPNAGDVLKAPGMKVLHVPDLDFLSTAPTLRDALRQVKTWSEANPRHVPILVLIELKDESIPALPTRLVPIDADGLTAVDAEIRAVFERSKILAPDDVRGDFATLPEAIATRGWPALEAVRGKVMFALDNEGRLRDLYLKGHDALKDRVMFATAPDPEHPSAAWFKVNDPVRDFERIRGLVRRGFLVRTRADADTSEARKNDTARRDRALASGAQFVSTDYPAARPEFSAYRVRFPGDVAARVNPVSGADIAPIADVEGPLRAGVR